MCPEAERAKRERQLLIEEALRHNPGGVGLMQAVTGTKRQEPT